MKLNTAKMVRLVAEMRALDRNSYLDQDILKRIEQAGRSTGLANKCVGLTISDVFVDAVFEIRRPRAAMRREPNAETVGDVEALTTVGDGGSELTDA